MVSILETIALTKNKKKGGIKHKGFPCLAMQSLFVALDPTSSVFKQILVSSSYSHVLYHSDTILDPKAASVENLHTTLRYQNFKYFRTMISHTDDMLTVFSAFHNGQYGLCVRECGTNLHENFAICSTYFLDFKRNEVKHTTSTITPPGYTGDYGRTRTSDLDTFGAICRNMAIHESQAPELERFLSWKDADFGEMGHNFHFLLIMKEIIHGYLL
jgi:hypothetical protein